MGIYGDIRRVYEMLGSEKCDLNQVREILSRLKERGVDKAFMKTSFLIIAKEEMVKALMEELGKK